MLRLPAHGFPLLLLSCVLFIAVTRVNGLYETVPSVLHEWKQTSSSQGYVDLTIGQLIDVNNDGLPDYVHAITGRDWSANNVYLNNGCEWVQVPKGEQLTYCATHMALKPIKARILLQHAMEAHEVAIPLSMHDLHAVILKKFSVVPVQIRKVNFHNALVTDVDLLRDGDVLAVITGENMKRTTDVQAEETQDVFSRDVELTCNP